MVPKRNITPVERIAVRGGDSARRADELATEEPLEIRVAGPKQQPIRIAVTMRTPSHDLELGAGFLFTEGLIRDAGELANRAHAELVVYGPGNVITLRLTHPFDAERVQRNFYATSSCGICGKASIDQIVVQAPHIPKGFVVGRSVLIGLPAALREAQAVFAQTGGLHATGLFDRHGSLSIVREDVGRHNAMDKVIGRMLLDQALPLSQHVALVSGRASFEIVQKAAMASIPVLCAVSAPSSLAVEAADRLGMTLVGFLRGESFNVYTHEARIDLGG